MSLRASVWLRSNGRCERCGIQLAGDWALHHRKLKSRGGKDHITNVVALHHHCHNLGTESVHLNVERATREGFLVPSWEDPATYPLRLCDDSLVLLTSDGSYEIVEGVKGERRSEVDRDGW